MRVLNTRADARGRSPDDRRDRHPVDRADGECRPSGGGGDGGGVRRSGDQPGRRACAAAATTAATASSSRARSIQRGVDVGVFLLGSVADVTRRRADQPRSPRPHRPDGRRDHQRAGVGAALQRDLRVRPDRRRDPRHRLSRAAERAARDRRRRRERARRAGRGDRSADRRLGRHARGRRRRRSKRR